MRDEPSALVGSFIALLQQIGCRGMCIAPRNGNNSVSFTCRDIEAIEVGAEALPGSWLVETARRSDDVSRIWLRPLASPTLPTYVFDRRDGFITIRRNRVDETGKARSLVFGVFVSTMIALDAIAHDIQIRGAIASVQ